MAKPNIPNVNVAYDINTLNKMAMRNGLKPLDPAKVAGMTKSQIKQYLKVAGKVQAMNRKDRRNSSRVFRKNAKAVASENLKQAQLMHGTIRQGLVELGGLGTEGIGGAVGTAITRELSAPNAIDQNTGGGTVEKDKDDNKGGPGSTEQGPMYAYKGRRED